MKKLSPLFLLIVAMSALTLGGCGSTPESGDKEATQKKSSSAESDDTCKVTTSRVRKKC